MIGGQLFADAISTGDFRRRRWNCGRTRITRASRLFLGDEVQGKQWDRGCSAAAWRPPPESMPLYDHERPRETPPSAGLLPEAVGRTRRPGDPLSPAVSRSRGACDRAEEH